MSFQDTTRSERTDRLLKAEDAVLEAGGCVLRLVGLYHSRRGAHTAFLRMGQVPRWGGYTVNLIHYEDAASLTAAILGYQQQNRGSEKRRAFVGCDGTPITFQAMMDAVKATGRYDGDVQFTGQQSKNVGKRMSNLATRELVGWQPNYASYSKFMQDGAEDFYSTSGLY
ncbi:hypothetical protein WJX84_007120 [Apatococcus fuscideae]|uniref:Uncharacterized protein n=1 Tax=Apatococcus fuscideae TaxID=2026836 RepID=A0AAW1SDK3_9CHLO